MEGPIFGDLEGGRDQMSGVLGLPGIFAFIVAHFPHNGIMD